MADGDGLMSDCIAALKLVAQLSWQRNLRAWLYVPIGILIILLACFGVNSLIGLSSVSFPASVALLVTLFLSLVLCSSIIGAGRTRALVSVIDIPTGFALRYINIFFTPSFVLLPLSPPISGMEVGKMIAVFLIGFLVMFSITAYIVRGLQLVLGSSKRTVTERAEEMGNENDAIPLTDSRTRQESEVTLVNEAQDQETSQEPTSGLATPPRAQDPSTARSAGSHSEADMQQELRQLGGQMQQAPLPLTRPQRWATFMNSNLDMITYGILFCLVGLPIYYTTGYAMPAHLTFNVLAYFTALAIPPRLKRFLHPVLVSSGITVMGIWILGLIRGDTLKATLDEYKTGTNYLLLWHGKDRPKPGAGDIFSSVLDASIVALALPMYNYRLELKRHFFAIVIPNVTISVGSLFGYPALCYAIGISSKRSLSFAVRSLTLALATPAVENLGGDSNAAAALAIMSGIFGVLIGPRMLQMLRIPDDDYVTRGVTLGGNSSAIATALLLLSDPRAAALSSLSMSLFGIITLGLTSVPPIARAIASAVNI